MRLRITMFITNFITTQKSRGVVFPTSSAIFVFTLLLICSMAQSAPRGKPRFIAIPLEDVQLVEVEDLPDLKSPTSHLVRAPRDIHSKPGSDQDPARFERQANDHHHHEYVDFGAHTGHHGSFGWYADFPVQDPGH